MSTASHSAAISRWVGIACLAHAPWFVLGPWNNHDVSLFALLAIAGVLLLGLGSSSFGANSSRSNRLRTSALVSLSLGACAFAFATLVSPWLLREPNFTGLARIVAWCLNLVVPADLSPEGNIVVRGSDGGLAFSLTPEKVGAPAVATFLVLGSYLVKLEGRRISGFFTLFSVVVIGSALQASVNILRFAQAEDVLAKRAENYLNTFQRPWEMIGWLVGTALCIAALRHRAQSSSPETTSAGRSRQSVFGGAWVCVGVFVLTFSSFAIPKGETKAGRVLIDDRLTDVWEPASRRLTNEWFGDFSTYSFSAAVEWIGYHFPTTVNCGDRYTDALLQDYDVFVLKTPSQQIEDEEIQAILRFVHNGGGLLLVGDHTNLLGMSSRLNQLAHPAGIHFAFDAVSDGQGQGFSVYEAGKSLAHPSANRVSRMQFMTSCSLTIRGAARPVLVAPKQMRQRGDYSSSSFFGSIQSDPRTVLGPAILAAEGDYGAGRIAAFSDSTVLSSFALFQYDRESYLVDTVAFLNTRQPDSQLIKLLFAVLSVAVIATGRWLLRGARPTSKLLATGLGPALSVLVAVSLAQSFNTRVFPSAEPIDLVPRMSVLTSDFQAMIPPVLGADVGDQADYAYDTWYVALSRAGVFPQLVDDLEIALQGDTLWVLNPVNGQDSVSQSRIDEWVNSGGHLVITCRSDAFYAQPIATYLGALGLKVDRDQDLPLVLSKGMELLPLPSSRFTGFTQDVGSGKITVVFGSEWWSRENLGHAFSVPGRERRLAYDSLQEILIQATPCVPQHRKVYEIRE